MRTCILSRVIATLALASLVSACSVTDEAPDPELSHRDVHFTLLHTADWHSRLFPYQMTVTATDANLGLQQSHAPFGGAARMNWLIQRERAQADRVLHLDSGDCFQGAPIFNFFSGEAEVRSLDATGVDGAAVGNHEFDRGALNFAIQYQRWATFPVLAANYLFEDPTTPGSAALSNFVRPYHIYDVRGLKVGVIGFGNLSSVTSLFDQPNRLGVTALNTQQVAQFYIDFLRAQNVDLIVGLSHLGLTDDQDMIATTSGFDVVLGGHLHIVLNPPMEISDCQAFDDAGQHFIPELDPNVTQASGPCDSNVECCRAFGVCQPDQLKWPGHSGWHLAPGYRPRYCHPRTVVLQHSGAFMKYLGRLDLILSDQPSEMVQGDGGPGGAFYDPIDRFEVISHRYTLFPVDSTVPEEPTVARLLEPYDVALGQIANLDNLVGYAPATISRTNQGGGDSPMGNLVCTAMWRRLGIQTDFAMTNTLGIRDAIPAGPVTIDQIYNVFPFDNQITTMLLSGREIRDMFDFIARRSAGRGCNSQAQIAGARVVVNCSGCDRDGIPGQDPGVDGACAETINIGLMDVTDPNGNPTGVPAHCDTNADCNPTPVPAEQRSLCEPTAHRCMLPIAGEAINGSYALATNDYVANGGSGFFVLQRNTTQVNTGVQLRDAVSDHVQLGNPCGFDQGTADAYRATHPGQAYQGDDGLQQCTMNMDCPSGFSCSCPDRYTFEGGMCSAGEGNPCASGSGRCVLTACRDSLEQQLEQRCPSVNPPDDPTAVDRCLCSVTSRAAETCRILACFDSSTGAFADGRILMRQ